MFIVLRYREKAPSSYPNWIEIPVNPPDARFSQIFNLQAKTVYEFQVIGTNEYGDGMFSEIIQASTKGNTFLSLLLMKDEIYFLVYTKRVISSLKFGRMKQVDQNMFLNLSSRNFSILSLFLFLLNPL